MIKKPEGCKNNPENPFTTKVGVHIPCGYSLSTIRTFDGIINKHDLHRNENGIKTFCESLREHAIKIINYEKKKMIPLTNKQQDSYERQKSAIFTNKSLNINIPLFRIIAKLEIIVIKQVNTTEVLNIAYLIENIVYLKKFQWFFKMDQTMIIILSQNS